MRPPNREVDLLRWESAGLQIYRAVKTEKVCYEEAKNTGGGKTKKALESSSVLLGSGVYKDRA
jgi:hypothetical protein